MSQLFRELIKRAGVYRDRSISKSEWVLRGDTVRYAAWDMIKEIVNYDFKVEKSFHIRICQCRMLLLMLLNLLREFGRSICISQAA